MLGHAVVVGVRHMAGNDVVVGGKYVLGNDVVVWEWLILGNQEVVGRTCSSIFDRFMVGHAVEVRDSFMVDNAGIL